MLSPHQPPITYLCNLCGEINNYFFLPKRTIVELGLKYKPTCLYMTSGSTRYQMYCLMLYDWLQISSPHSEVQQGLMPSMSNFMTSDTLNYVI